MGMNLNAAAVRAPDTKHPAGQVFHDFEQQCLRILRCTAVALANSPGGLRFKAGTRPWLDALSPQYADLSLSIQNGV